MTVAPIVHFDLTLRVREKRQLRKLIKELVGNDSSHGYNFSFRSVHYEGSDMYEVIIQDCSWAANITWIGKLMEKVDHQS